MTTQKYFTTMHYNRESGICANSQLRFLVLIPNFSLFLLKFGCAKISTHAVHIYQTMAQRCHVLMKVLLKPLSNTNDIRTYLGYFLKYKHLQCAEIVSCHFLQYVTEHFISLIITLVDNHQRIFPLKKSVEKSLRMERDGERERGREKWRNTYEAMTPPPVGSLTGYRAVSVWLPAHWKWGPHKVDIDTCTENTILFCWMWSSRWRDEWQSP